jgi:aspartate-semialdehyde dehydrogenase
METETLKILGGDGGRAPYAAAISAHTNRVPVIDGHTEAVSVRLRGNPSPERVREALGSFRAAPQELALPSAPPLPVLVHERPERPQPRLDLAEGGGGSGATGDSSQGMSVHIGRVRPCPVLGIKFTLLGHNAERGAAGASLLNAELAVATRRLG